MTRGVKQSRDIFVTFMQTQMFKWTRKNLKTGQDENFMVQGALRPIELWEYVFPEEAMEEVLTMLDVESESKSYPKLQRARLVALRKVLQAEKIPPYKKAQVNRFIERHGVAIHPIGIRRDKRQEKQQWGYEQELL